MSAWTKPEGRLSSTARKNRPLTGWCHDISAWWRSLFQRGRSSGCGRRPRTETPSVASMFSPSTRRYVVRSVMGRPYALSVPHALPEACRCLRGSTRRVPRRPQRPTALIDSTAPTDPIERADATEPSPSVKGAVEEAGAGRGTCGGRDLHRISEDASSSAVEIPPRMHYDSIARNRRRNEWGMRVHDDLGRERRVCGGARDRFSDRSSTHATCPQNRSSTHMGFPQIRPHFAWSLPVRVSQEYARRRRRGDSSSVLE